MTVTSYRIMFFDFDGVISDSLNICMEEINNLSMQMFPQIPAVHSKDDMVVVYGERLRDSLKRFGLSDGQSRLFFDLHSKAMARRKSEIYPFEKMVRTLSDIPLRKVIVTSSYSTAVYEILSKCYHFREDSFQMVLGREVKLNKSQKIRKAIQFFEATYEEALYLGDLVSDIIYCRDIPIDIAAVGYGYHPPEYLQRFHPTFLLKSEDEVESFLYKLID